MLLLYKQNCLFAKKGVLYLANRRITGSLTQKYGCYYCVINLYDENGKRKQKWIPTNLPIKGNKKRATDILKAKIRELEEMNVEYYIDITFAQYLTLWLREIEKEVKPNTYRSYKGNMENHIIPYFIEKKIKLQELKPNDLTVYYRHVRDNTDLSTVTIKHHHQNISKALSDAIRKGYISTNPATHAQTIKIEKYQAKFLNSRQLNKMLELFENSTVELPIFLCSVYGLRRSEACGLRWCNIDFENGTIHICETLQQSTKKISGKSNYTDNTKTESSNRTLPILSKVKNVLLQQQENQRKNKELLESGYFDSDYVCTFVNGQIITPNYLTRVFHKIIKDSDLPQIRLHDLRHSVASNLLNEQGFSVVQVANWLGHSSSATTLNFYAHIDKTSKMDIAESLEKVFAV